MRNRIASVFCAGIISLGFISTVDASLVLRLGGQAVYDTDRNITWLADANLAASNTFGVAGISGTGGMTWDTANTWITAMNASGGTGHLGFNDWRLPSALNTDGSGPCEGVNCTDSEMGHLFYTEIGATANTLITTTGDPVELAKFTNIGPGFYWSSEEFSFGDAWTFIVIGVQTPLLKIDAIPNVWVVRSGDVSAVPVPAASWLMVSGLLGLLGVVKRKNA